jgi:hypothetical protein
MQQHSACRESLKRNNAFDGSRPVQHISDGILVVRLRQQPVMSTFSVFIVVVDFVSFFKY